jgi:hypothetical protein
MDLIKGKQYIFTVMHEGEYMMKYAGSKVDKQDEAVLMFENEYAEDDLDPEFIEFSTTEIISMNII